MDRKVVSFVEDADRRKIFTRASCEGCDVARRNIKHQGPSETEKNETIEEKFIRRDRETAHSRQGQREQDARQAKEEDVVNVNESMYECNQHE